MRLKLVIFYEQHPAFELLEGSKPHVDMLVLTAEILSSNKESIDYDRKSRLFCKIF